MPLNICFQCVNTTNNSQNFYLRSSYSYLNGTLFGFLKMIQFGPILALKIDFLTIIGLLAIFTTKINFLPLNISFQCVNNTTCNKLRQYIIICVDHHFSCADCTVSSKYSSSLVRYHSAIQPGMHQKYWHA